MPMQFPSEVDYFLDCAVEYAEMIPDAALFLRLFAPNDTQVNRIVDESGRADYRTSTTAAVKRVTERAYELMDKVPSDNPLLQEIFLSSTRGISWQIEEMSHEIAGDIVSRVTNHGKRLPTKLAVRRMYSEACQWQAVRNDRRLLHYKDQFSLHLRQSRRIANKLRDVDLVTAPISDLARVREGLAFYYRLPVAGKDDAYTRAKRREQREKQAKGRRMLRRALALAESVVGQAALYDFIHGKDVLLLGSTFAFLITKAGHNLIDLHGGHGMMTIEVCDRETLDKLARLCVYFDKTPSLDQLAALKMSCDAGLDAEVVYDANIVQEYPAARSHKDFLAVRELKTNDVTRNRQLREIARIDPDALSNRVLTINDVNYGQYISTTIRSSFITRGTNFVTTQSNSTFTGTSTSSAYISTNSSASTFTLTVPFVDVDAFVHEAAAKKKNAIDRADKRELASRLIGEDDNPRVRYRGQKQVMTWLEIQNGQDIYNWSRRRARDPRLAEPVCNKVAAFLTNNDFKLARQLVAIGKKSGRYYNPGIAVDGLVDDWLGGQGRTNGELALDDLFA